MKSVQFTESADKQTKLDVLVEVGSVTIRPSTNQKIHIEATYRHMDVWVERRDDTVIVRAEQEDDFLQKLGRLFNNDHAKADIVIDLPAHCEIQAKTITGSLAVEGSEAPVSARVITGNLTLKAIHGPIYAKIVTGKLAYTGELTEENHRFEAVTGELLLTVPPTTNAQFSAQTATGSVRCLLPLADLHEHRHFVGGKLQGTLGTGAGRVKAKISTGNLLIKALKEKTAALPAEKHQFA